jgi:hypothetical protein
MNTGKIKLVVSRPDVKVFSAPSTLTTRETATTATGFAWYRYSTQFHDTAATKDPWESAKWHWIAFQPHIEFEAEARDASYERVKRRRTSQAIFLSQQAPCPIL